MNTNTELGRSRIPVINGAASRGNVPARHRTETISRTHARELTNGAAVVEGRRVALPAPVITPEPAVRNGSAAAGAPPRAARLGIRQLAFRCVRLTLAGGMVSAAVLYARSVVTTARSEQAWLNAEITALRAPIAGQVQLEGLRTGQPISAGQKLFTVENARFGNEQALSQLNWVSELAQRLEAESEEAAVRLRRQEEVTRLHEKMYAEQILPRIELIEEQSRLELARTVHTNKVALAKKASERVSELTRQVQLQQTAVVTMPFTGVAWAISAKAGAQVALHETVLEAINPERVWVEAYFHERHAGKLTAGTEVDVQLEAGGLPMSGRVESVRGSVGRAAPEGSAVVPPEMPARGTISVRVRLESPNPLEADQFYGVGRRAVVTVRE